MIKVTAKIFVLQPPNSNKYLNIYKRIIFPAAQKNAAQVYRIDDFPPDKRIIESVYEEIESANLIICDITQNDPNVMYQLGFAHASKKPVILLTATPDETPFDITTTRTLVYDPNPFVLNNSIDELSLLIKEALINPQAFNAKPTTDRSINTVFISYSHKDVKYLDRLKVHLKPLEKSGLIDAWSDTKLTAGDNWQEEINIALSKARVAILLISADFLASDFIIENELPPLLEKAKTRGVRIIPIIVKQCRYTRDNKLKHFRAVNDLKRSLSILSEAEQEIIYDEVSEIVEKAVVKSG